MNMTKKQAERNEACARLRNILAPGNTVNTVLRKVSRSGMYRRIVVLASIDGRVCNISRDVAIAIDSRWHDDGSVGMGGCGMDMGFHIVHNLGYALWGQIAEHGTDLEAVQTRKAILAADTHYFTQGGATAPDPDKPGREWFGGSGYALKHRWV